MKKLFDFLLSGSKVSRVILPLLISFVLTAVLGGLFSIALGGEVLKVCKITFLWFFAPGVVSAALVLFLNIREGLEYGFGNGLYYGSIAVAAFLYRIYPAIPSKVCLLIGFVIAALVCYIVYLKKYRIE